MICQCTKDVEYSLTMSKSNPNQKFDEGLEKIRPNINNELYIFLRDSKDKREALTLILEYKYNINLDWLYSLL